MATEPKKDERPDPATMSFEAATEELETLIERIESGEIGLEESLAERRRGDALIKRCRAVLEAAEQELETLAAETIDEADDDQPPT